MSCFTLTSKGCTPGINLVIHPKNLPLRFTPGAIESAAGLKIGNAKFLGFDDPGYRPIIGAGNKRNRALLAVDFALGVEEFDGGFTVLIPYSSNGVRVHQQICAPSHNRSTAWKRPQEFNFSALITMKEGDFFVFSTLPFRANGVARMEGLRLFRVAFVRGQMTFGELKVRV